MLRFYLWEGLVLLIYGIQCFKVDVLLESLTLKNIDGVRVDPIQRTFTSHGLPHMLFGILNACALQFSMHLSQTDLRRKIWILKGVLFYIVLYFSCTLLSVILQRFHPAAGCVLSLIRDLV